MKLKDDVEVPPWARGPLELIKHANGHLEQNGDTDRRLALIGFDNAIEVCIEVYVRLHPKLRGGETLDEKQVAKALTNYHTKMEFLDEHIASKQLDLEVPVTSIVWYHSLRNELYHSGNGMVPEQHAIEGSAKAAAAVFRAMFGVNISAEPQGAPEDSARDAISGNPAMDFLSAYGGLETAIRGCAASRPGGANYARRWREHWAKFMQELPQPERETLETARRLRNELAHQGQVEASSDQLLELAIFLLDITDRCSRSARLSATEDDSE